MEVKVGKISFNLESPDLATKEAFKKAFKGRLKDTDQFWRLIQKAKREASKK